MADPHLPSCARPHAFARPNQRLTEMYTPYNPYPCRSHGRVLVDSRQFMPHIGNKSQSNVASWRKATIVTKPFASKQNQEMCGDHTSLATY